jgi:hypothetical protein
MPETPSTRQCPAVDCGEDVGDFGAGGVVRVDVDPPDDVLCVDEDCGGHREMARSIGVDVREVEPEGDLGGGGVLGGLGEDAEGGGDLVSGVAEDCVGEAVGLCCGEGAVGLLWADGDERDVAGVELGG